MERKLMRKEVQIQLTGFMEKNTGKFMKELWNLLRSAEENASGVPQQLLDAKEEEIRKKKEEADRITLEIQKKRDIEQEKAKEMDGEVDKTRSHSDGFNPLPKRLPPVGEKDIVSEERNGSRGKNGLAAIMDVLVIQSKHAHRFLDLQGGDLVHFFGIKIVDPVPFGKGHISVLQSFLSLAKGRFLPTLGFF